MKLLPKRYISLPCPIPAMRGVCGDLVPSEESIRLWLGAWPGLLAWKEAINWISPGVGDPGRKSREGPWGVGSNGSLLIVETAIDRGDTPDPFAKVLQYVKSASMRRQWVADALRIRALKHCRRNSFVQETIKQLQLAYCASFVPLIGSDSYQQSIESSLRIRDDLGNPLPVFIAVVASIQPDFCLSPEALRNFELLQKYVGSDRVVLRILRARLTPRRHLVIECRSPESNDVARVVTRKLL